MNLRMRTFACLIAVLASNSTLAAPVYLNNATPISAVLGSGTTMTSANNTFGGSNQLVSEVIGLDLVRAIDAPSADASEVHNQSTHNWFRGPDDGVLEVLFDFGEEYAITELHFWNFAGEFFDVDLIEFFFFDSSNTSVDSPISLAPALGSVGGILAEDISLVSPLNVQCVTALLSGTGGEVDFQNIGFAAELTTDICMDNPNLPVWDVPPPA